MPDVHIHPIGRRDVICPNPCEQCAREMETPRRESPLLLKRGAHAAHGIFVERVAQSAHLRCCATRARREGRLRALMEESMHRALGRGDQQLLLSFVYDGVDEHAFAAAAAIWAIRRRASRGHSSAHQVELRLASHRPREGFRESRRSNQPLALA